jgi:hypothetical protein
MIDAAAEQLIVERLRSIEQRFDIRVDEIMRRLGLSEEAVRSHSEFVAANQERLTEQVKMIRELRSDVNRHETLFAEQRGMSKVAVVVGSFLGTMASGILLLMISWYFR